MKNEALSFENILFAGDHLLSLLHYVTILFLRITLTNNLSLLQTPIIQCNMELTTVVRKELAMALRDLLQHGLMEVINHFVLSNVQIICAICENPVSIGQTGSVFITCITVSSFLLRLHPARPQSGGLEPYRQK